MFYKNPVKKTRVPMSFTVTKLDMLPKANRPLYRVGCVRFRAPPRPKKRETIAVVLLAFLKPTKGGTLKTGRVTHLTFYPFGSFCFVLS